MLDRAGFEALFRAHSARVYSIGVRITGDRATAEDVVQETFAKAYTASQATEFDDIGAWLGTVARNASLNAVRDRVRTVALAEEAGGDPDIATPGMVLADASPTADPAHAAASSDAVRGAWELVDELRPAARAAVVLRYAEDLPIDTIARTLGKSVNATTVLLHRARASLRAAYAARVFARAGLPEACRARRDEIVRLVEGQPTSDELREHMAACADCQQSADDLRGMTRAFAVAPLFVVPATLGPKVAAAVGATGAAAAAAGAGAGAGAAGASGAAATTGAGAGASVPGGAAGAAAGAAGTSGTGGSAAAGASAAMSATAVSAGTGTTGAAAGGGILATVGQLVATGIAVVAIVGSVGIATGLIDRASAETPTVRPAELTAAQGGASGAPLGAAGPAASPATGLPAGIPPVTTPPVDPTSVGTDQGPAAQVATQQTVPGPTSAATTRPRPTATPTAAPTPTSTPRPRSAAQPSPTPAVARRTGNAGAIWAAGPSCGATAQRFAAGEALWVTVRGFAPGSTVPWRITAQPGSHPARLDLAGSLRIARDGSACAPIWTVPAASEALGLFRVEIAGKQKVIRLNRS